jgi:hypothetical protein
VEQGESSKSMRIQATNGLLIVVLGPILGHELLGAWVTLSLAVRLGLDQLQIFGDSKVIIEWLNGRGNLNAYALLGWMNMIKALKKFV